MILNGNCLKRREKSKDEKKFELKLKEVFCKLFPNKKYIYIYV